MKIRIHKGAKFAYINNDRIGFFTVKDIAIIADGQSTETRVYFNDSLDNCDGIITFNMSPKDFYDFLENARAEQV